MSSDNDEGEPLSHKTFPTDLARLLRRLNKRSGSLNWKCEEKFSNRAMNVSKGFFVPSYGESFVLNPREAGTEERADSRGAETDAAVLNASWNNWRSAQDKRTDHYYVHIVEQVERA